MQCSEKSRFISIECAQRSLAIEMLGRKMEAA
jgi:hypothetical protein